MLPIVSDSVCAFIWQTVNINVTECIVCVSGHDPLTFLSGPFPLWLGKIIMAPIIQLSKVLKVVRWARRVLFPPVSLGDRGKAGRELVIVRAAAYASDSGESLHCFLVGVQIKVML